MLEFDRIIDHKPKGEMQQVNLGLKKDGLSCLVGTGFKPTLAAAVFEAVNKAGKIVGLDPDQVEVVSEGGVTKLVYAGIEEVVIGEGNEALARAYLKFLENRQGWEGRLVRKGDQGERV